MNGSRITGHDKFVAAPLRAEIFMPSLLWRIILFRHQAPFLAPATPGACSLQEEVVPASRLMCFGIRFQCLLALRSTNHPGTNRVIGMDASSTTRKRLVLAVVCHGHRSTQPL